MGFALAEAARERGATVTLVAGPTAVEPPTGVAVTRVTSTQDLLAAMEALCNAQDVIIQAAAPADYRFAEPSHRKLKKADGMPLTLQLVENPDVAKAVAARRHAGQTLVGFAAETHNGLANARRKRESKGLDIIVYNDVTKEGAGFNADTNIATVITAENETEYPLMSKQELAGHVLNTVLALRNRR